MYLVALVFSQQRVFVGQLVKQVLQTVAAAQHINTSTTDSPATTVDVLFTVVARWCHGQVVAGSTQ